MSYCDWDQSSELNTRYHDTEWGAGRPVDVLLAPTEAERRSTSPLPTVGGRDDTKVRDIPFLL